MKTKCSGLHLWKVGIEFIDGFTKENELWITTDTGSLAKAAEKAKRFLRGQKTEFPRSSITAVKYHGTIDA